jgi:hypothetical protein
MDFEAREALRKNLLSYCERDTLAMVKLHERLCAFAGLSEAVVSLL